MQLSLQTRDHRSGQRRSVRGPFGPEGKRLIRPQPNARGTNFRSLFGLVVGGLLAHLVSKALSLKSEWMPNRDGRVAAPRLRSETVEGV